ncbi:MAG: hypothetical protein IJW21_05145 [Clostridia bacterium]|nr:hypothetical protein [Clostridia bacterium]
MYTKEIPEIIAGAPALKLADAEPFFSEDGSVCAVLAGIHCNDTGTSLDITVIVNLAKKKFSFTFFQAEKPALHPLTERKGKVLLINRDGSKRGIEKLTQYPLEKLPKVRSVDIKLNMFNNVQAVPVFEK